MSILSTDMKQAYIPRPRKGTIATMSVNGMKYKSNPNPDPMANIVEQIPAQASQGYKYNAV